MSLLSKDGKPYKCFSEPNPIVKDQEELPTNELIFHNFKWQPLIMSGVPKRKKPILKPVERPIVGMVEETIEPKKPQKTKVVTDFLELLKTEAKAIKKEIPVEPPKKEIVDPFENDATVLVHCHPAVIKEKIDEFYGEKRYKLEYGNKFSFHALIIDWDEFEISLFCKEELKKGSIIYPSKYVYGSEEQLQMYRWWSISNIVPKNDGFIIFAAITDKQRDFSD